MNDVAKAAKVSVATVSRVVNSSGGVSPKLERRVRRAMDKLQYHPSSLARSFKMQRTHLIGVLVPLLDHPFYSRLATAIEQRLFESDYHALICNSGEDPQREEAYIEMLLRQRVDGVIVNSAAHNTRLLQQINAQNVPLVLIDRDLQDVNSSKVFSDNSQGAALGMQHLIDLGHRRIGVIGGPTDTEPIQRRLRGVREALAANDLPYDPELVITSDTQLFDMGYRSAAQLLARPQPPTAIFALTDVTAVGVLHAAAKYNYRIPHDLSVLGYDDLALAAYTLPPLTTVKQPIEAMGATAAAMLLHQIEAETLDPTTAVLPTQLVQRQTTAPPS